MADVGLGPGANGWSSGAVQSFGTDAFCTPYSFETPNALPFKRPAFFDISNGSAQTNYPPTRYQTVVNTTSGSISVPFTVSFNAIIMMTPGASTNLYYNEITGISYRVYFTDFNTFNFEVIDGGTTATIQTSSIYNINGPQMFHVIASYQPVSGDVGVTPMVNRMSLYINGVGQDITTSDVGTVNTLFLARTQGPGNYQVTVNPSFAIITRVIETFGGLPTNACSAWRVFNAAFRYLPPWDVLFKKPGTPAIFGIPAFQPLIVPTKNIINIFGTGFTGTSSVTINGVSAGFNVINDNYIQATVPVSATTGNIAVTNAGGTTTTVGKLVVAPNWKPQITSFQF